MSYDLQINKVGKPPINSIDLSVEDHWGVFSKVSEASFPILAKMSHYYVDAEISIEHLPAALKECAALSKLLESDSDNKNLAKIQRLFERALVLGQPVSCLAD